MKIITKITILSIDLMSIVIIDAMQTGARWNKHSKTFEPIPGLPTYEEERKSVVGQSRLEETHNFNGQPLTLTYYEEEGVFEFRDNDTKVSGIAGDMWTILSGLLNFRLVLIKSTDPSLGETLPDGTYTGLLEIARLNKTDIVPKVPVYITRIRAVEYSPVLWKCSLRIFAHDQWKRNRAWMFTLLPINLWALIFMVVMTLSLASMISQRILIRHRGRKMDSETFFHHLFYTFATMCNQPSSASEKTGSGSKMLKLAMVVFGFLILAAYNSNLIYSMAQESFQPPFSDLQTLLNNTKYRVVILNSSLSYRIFYSPYALPIFGKIRKARRVLVVNSIEDVYEKVCKGSQKFVMFGPDETVALRKNKECNVIPVGPLYYPLPIASGFSRRVKYRKSVYTGIMKLREVGLLTAMKKRFMTSNRAGIAVRQVDSLTIDMERVLLIFGVYLLGIITSIIMCVVENIIVILKKRYNL